MKQLNETFEDKEHAELTKGKNNLKMNWHDYILFLHRFYEKNKKSIKSKE